MNKILLFVLIICSCNKLNAQNINIDSVVRNFKGYKVPSNVKSLGANYWKTSTPLMIDLIIQTFQKPLSFAEIATQRNCIQGGWGGATCGDFNNDGYIDVFTPGAIDSSSYKDRNRGVGFSFLLWDSVNKVFIDTNLINDKKLEVIISAGKVVPVYLNSDNYVDLVIFPVDDAIAPIKLLISDSKGGYDYTEIITNENDVFNPNTPNSRPTIYKGTGDVGDLNGDGYPDLFIPALNFSYIIWGTPNFPYFNPINHPRFVKDTINFPGISNNGFGEVCSNCVGGYLATIYDVNKDGLNDVIMYNFDPNFDIIMINQGGGKFNDNGIIRLPRYIEQGDGGDYLMMDVNDDGLNDFVTLTGGGLSGKKSYNNVFTIVQNTNRQFNYDTAMIQYSNNFQTKRLGSAGGTGAFLFKYDFNQDGKMDIGYVNSGWGDDCGIYDSLSNTGNIMPYKTVFIREGNKFIEKDFYQFDLYAKSLLTQLRKRFLCSISELPKPILSVGNTDFAFCKSDSIRISINNYLSGFTYIWNQGSKKDTLNQSSKFISDTTNLSVLRVNKEFGCSATSEKIKFSFRSTPDAPIVRDTAYCFNSNPISLSATTLPLHDVYWSDQAGMLGAKYTPTPNTTIQGEKKYYVTQINLSTNCKSPQVSLKVTIEKSANAPSVKDTAFCQNANSSTLIAYADLGNYLKWYSTDASGGNSSTQNTIAITVDTITRSYYVSQATNLAGCESPRAKISVKINPNPPTPFVKDSTYCQNSIADTLRATASNGNILQWFGTNAAGGNTLSSPNVPSTTQAGIQNYFVSQKSIITGCESPRAKINIKINPIPGLPIIKDTSYCQNQVADTLRALAESDNKLLWYGINATGGTSSNTPILPSTVNVGIQNYYVSQKIISTGCEGLRSKISITIKPIPTAPLLNRDTSNFLIANVNGITWYKDGILISDTNQKIKPIIQGSYSAKTTLNGCTSAMSNTYYFLVTDIINLSSDEFIKLTPNPFSSQLNFDFIVKGYQKLNLEIYEIASGAKVDSRTNITAGVPVYLNHLSVGTYLVKVTSNDLKISYQFKMVKL